MAGNLNKCVNITMELFVIEPLVWEINVAAMDNVTILDVNMILSLLQIWTGTTEPKQYDSLKFIFHTKYLFRNSKLLYSVKI